MITKEELLARIPDGPSKIRFQELPDFDYEAHAIQGLLEVEWVNEQHEGHVLIAECKLGTKVAHGMGAEISGDGKIF